MAIVLPEEPVKASRIDPAILLIYGAKKVGKTELLRQLPNCLILDGEKGTVDIDALKTEFNSVPDLKEIIAAIKAKGQKRLDENIAAKKAGKPEPYPGDALFPYRYLALDTIDALEDMIIPWETRNFKQTVLGKRFEGNSILELANGLGYYYLREAMKKLIYELCGVCRTLIIVSHLAEKVVNKGGIDTLSQDISLTGKLGQIICSMVPAIGYVTRKPSNKEGVVDPITISFRTTDGVTMGARTAHLKGRTFEFSWDKIFIEDPILHPELRLAS